MTPAPSAKAIPNTPLIPVFCPLILEITYFILNPLEITEQYKYIQVAVLKIGL